MEPIKNQAGRKLKRQNCEGWVLVFGAKPNPKPSQERKKGKETKANTSSEVQRVGTCIAPPAAKQVSPQRGCQKDLHNNVDLTCKQTDICLFLDFNSFTK